MCFGFSSSLLASGAQPPSPVGVDRHVVDGVEELLDQLGLQELRLDELRQRLAHASCGTRPWLIFERAAPITREPAGIWCDRQAPEQARQDLAVREIAGRPEDHQVERLHGDDG